MEIAALADPCSVLAVIIARPCRSECTVASPFSTVRLAMDGLMDHSASLMGKPVESTTERLSESFTSIESALGVIATAEEVRPWPAPDVDRVRAKNSVTRASAANSAPMGALGSFRVLPELCMCDQWPAPAKRTRENAVASEIDYFDGHRDEAWPNVQVYTTDIYAADKHRSVRAGATR